MFRAIKKSKPLFIIGIINRSNIGKCYPDSVGGFRSRSSGTIDLSAKCERKKL